MSTLLVPLFLIVKFMLDILISLFCIPHRSITFLLIHQFLICYEQHVDLQSKLLHHAFFIDALHSVGGDRLRYCRPTVLFLLLLCRFSLCCSHRAVVDVCSFLVAASWFPTILFCFWSFLNLSACSAFCWNSFPFPEAEQVFLLFLSSCFQTCTELCRSSIFSPEEVRV